DGGSTDTGFTGIYSLTTSAAPGGDVRVGGGRLAVVGNAGVGAGHFLTGPAGQVQLQFEQPLPPAQPRVTVDGTTGSAADLRGPDYELTAILGQHAGGTQFYSLGRLELAPFESLTLDVPSGTPAVVVRTSGNEAAAVEGKLVAANPGTELYLLAP